MTGLVFEKLAQPLAGNQAWPLVIAGDFFRIDSADWPVTVALYKASREVGRMANVRAGDYVRDIAFDEVRVINGATAQTVTVQIAGGGVGSDRVIGEVAVIDGGRAVTIANRAFWTAMGLSAAVGNYSHVQIWNPAGSGRALVVKKLGLGSAVAGTVSFGMYGASLTTMSAGPAYSKLSGGANSIVERRSQAAAAVLTTAMHGAMTIQANKTELIQLEEPFYVLPGFGMMAYHNATNADVVLSVEFREEPL